MPIHFACPACHTPHTVNDRMAGQLIDCPACSGPMVVPGGTVAPYSTPAAPVVVYVPPPDPMPREVYVREHFVHQERGTFLSAFGRTMGEGCGCIVLALIVGGLALAAVVVLALLAHPNQ